MVLWRNAKARLGKLSQTSQSREELTNGFACEGGGPVNNIGVALSRPTAFSKNDLWVTMAQFGCKM